MKCIIVLAYGVVAARWQPWREAEGRVCPEEADADQTYLVNADQQRSPGSASAATQYPPHSGRACDDQQAGTKKLAI
jgi:hypothetical protein